MSSALVWFRVEFDATGRVCACERVAAEQEGSASVHFVLAVNSAAAERAAYREDQARRMRTLRERYVAEGKCRCGRSRERETPQQRSFACCPVCTEAVRASKSRRIAINKGLAIPALQPKTIAFAARAAERTSEHELEILEEVQQAFQELTMRNFGLWLQARIDRHKKAEASP